jgi:hypothetical protein
MKTRQKITIIAAAALGAQCCVALGSDVHDVDFFPAVIDNKIVTGTVNGQTGEVDYPSQIKSANFGAEGFPNFTNNPGFNSELGGLIPSMTIGFNILSAPRVWDNDNQNFDTIATEQFTVRAAAQNFIAPSTDLVVPGVVFGQASSSPAASFHHHIQYLMNGGLPPMIQGVWMLELELWTEMAGIEPSDPLYLVFGQGDGIDQIDDAITWIEENLIASPCVADLNGDGELNFFDVSAFLTAYNSQDPAADLTGDGLFNFFDVSAFLSAYGAGCP